MTTSNEGVARYLDLDGTAAYAVLHETAPMRRATAVLLLAPFGWDDTSSYRARRTWAVSLADDGYPVLRLDLPGTGDSGGGPSDPDRVPAWIAAITAAVHELRAATGCPRVALVGLGLGGLLGLAATDAGASVDELVLWAAPGRGRAIVRELKAFAQMEASRAPDAGPLPDGAFAANGYLLTADTVAALTALDAASMAAPGVERALLLGRDGLPVDDKVRSSLETSGVKVTVADGPGYGALTSTHQQSRLPRTTMGTVAAWLAEGGTPIDADPAPPPPEHRAPRTTTTISVGGDEIRERLVTFDQRDVRLVGVLAEPTAEPAPLCAVLLNAGAQRRIGPNRMWVEAARRWATRGVPTLRVDLASIGDSGGRDRFPIADRELYEGEYGEQVSGILDHLVGLGLPERFLLMGLCSGAYWSFRTGQVDERVAGVVLLNPLALVFDPFQPTIRQTQKLRRLSQPAMWGRLLRGDVAGGNIREVARATVMRGVTSPQRLVGRIVDNRRAARAGGNELDYALDRLRDNGVRARLVFTASEPLRRELAHDGFFERLDRWPNLLLHLLDGPPDTHTLQPLAVQREIHEVIDMAVDALLVGRIEP
ncbi:MAG: hypothetical protein QOD30_198 [Actinomycetota bacterium]|nr:hypothetical protein [Actinomycetota bacterium]